MKRIGLAFSLLTLIIPVLLVGCSTVSIYAQRATATAYSTEYMTTAMQAAESGAMALCNIDFTAGRQAYIDQICAASSALGCSFFTNQVAQAWADLERAYSANVLECQPATSRFLEEGSNSACMCNIGWSRSKAPKDGRRVAVPANIGSKWRKRTAIGN
jgi:uncharacterized protein YceK